MEEEIKLYMTKDVANMLNIGEQHVRNMARNGVIRCYKEGRKGGFRFLKEDIQSYINKKFAERGL